MTNIAPHLAALIGKTPILKVPSLSELTGCEILLKCEQLNPGGSIKDRAALQMVQDAMEKGELKPGMTIVEGTAGNTGIGLALVAKSYGFKMIAVMPKGQAIEKERMLSLFGAQLELVDPVPFRNENHFYHTARRLAEGREDYWWANQFENLSNFRAHYLNTGPEIEADLDGHLDYLVSVAGTGGTIGGNSKYLKEKIPGLQVHLVDPPGSGLKSYLETGEFKAEGSSFTEGIGIMRLVANFAQAQVDKALSLPDQDIVTVAHHLQKNDSIVLGSSAALNVAAALLTAAQAGPGKRILTFLCDLGERSYSKLYNPEFLASKAIDPDAESIEALFARYQKEPA